MRFLRSLRWLLLAAVLVPLAPAFAHAAVFISVGFAPPPMPVYVQPPCPQPGWMWTPGYWAYGPDGYYWVPGTWVPAPYAGALWTPGYWGWNSGLYMWHPGYWARHVGYYGGINYGFGYFGMGFAGGMWHGDRFMYNTAVMRVNTTVIRNTYIDRTVIQRNTIVNDRRIAYNGGPGGIRHMPTAGERMADNERHMGRTAFQTQHVDAAMRDRGAYFNNNHGHPPVMAQERPRGMGGANGFQQRGREQMRQQPQYQQRQHYQQRQQEQVSPQRQDQQRPEQMRQQPQYQQRGPEQRRPEARPQREQRQERPQGRNDERGRWR